MKFLCPTFGCSFNDISLGTFDTSTLNAAKSACGATASVGGFVYAMLKYTAQEISCYSVVCGRDQINAITGSLKYREILYSALGI